MSTSKYIGRVGALAVALGVGFAVTVAPGGALAESPDPPDPPIDRTALIMGGGTVSTPDDYLVEIIKNHYIVPTHPNETIKTVAVSTPMEAWPLTGVIRLLGTLFGPPSVWGPGGAGWWPNDPWKLTGLFDLTLNQAVQAGLGNLETAMAKHGNDPLVIYGISEGSIIANREKRKLAEQYPKGTDAPDIDFVMQGTFNLPNGGVFARFPGLYLPILDWSFNGPAPTDTQFDTVMINRQYEFPSDVPLYPGNVIADLNVFLGGVYLHTYSWDDSLAVPDPTKLPSYQGTHGDTDYYFFETQDLPLFGPLRTLGVPESLIDVVEPFFRVIVETGYDRSIKPWEPTPARLIPRINPATLAADLIGAIGEGINNALAITGSQAQLRSPAAPVVRTANADISDKTMSVQRVTETVEVKPLEQRTETVEVKPLEQKAKIDQAALPERETDTEQAKSENFSIPKLDKKADRPPAHRPVRDALKEIGQRIRSVLHPRASEAPIAVAPAEEDGPAPAGPPSDNDPDDKEADGS